jgi:hypothetical protein
MSSGSVQWLADEINRRGPKENNPPQWLKELYEQAKEMEVMGREMSYSDGYAEGYKRAYELMEWCMKNYIKGKVQDHIGDTNKKVERDNNDR